MGVVTSKPQTLPVIVNRTPCSRHGFASVFFKVECLAHVVTPSVIDAALYDSVVKRQELRRLLLLGPAMTYRILNGL